MKFNSCNRFSCLVSLLLGGIQLVTIWPCAAQTEGPLPPDFVGFQEPVPEKSSVSSFEPLHLEMRFSPEPTEREFFEAPVFQQPLVPVGATSAQENIALAQALRDYVRRADPDDHSAVIKFLQDNPRSAWKPALLFNLGVAWRHAGFFSRSVAAWEDAWKLSRAAKDISARALADRTLGELVKMYSWVGQMEKLEPLMDAVKSRQILGGSKETVSSASYARWFAQNRPDELLKCGPLALRQILAVNQTNADPRDLFKKKAGKDGFSLFQLKELANESGLEYQMAKRTSGSSIPPNSVIHWKLNHYGVVSKEDGDHYIILDTTFSHLYGDALSVNKSALEEESDGYFLIPAGQLPTGWVAVSDEDGQRVFGKGLSPTRVETATTPQDELTCDLDGDQPMARYRAHLMLASLNIVDTPVKYSPPAGPPIEFKVTYSQRDAQSQPNQAFSNLGSQWTCDWFTCIKDHGQAESTVTRYVGGGGQMDYTGYNASTGYYGTDRWGNVLQYVAGPDTATGLVGYWPMDESLGSVAADASGSGNNGTLTGPAWATGKVGPGSLSFDGVNDYLQVGNRPNLVMSGSLTMCAWIYPTGNSGIIINKEGEYEMTLQGGKVKFALANTSPGWTYTDTGFTPLPNQWSHVALTYDHGLIKFYVNGAVFYTFSGSGNIGDTLSYNDFRIGGRQCCSEYFRGQIDEVRMYNRALSAADIAALLKPADLTTDLVGYWPMDEMSGSVAADGTHSGNDGTLNGPSWCAGQIGAGALSFDGVNDYVQVGARPNLIMTSALTMTAWIYPTIGSGMIVNKEGEYELAIQSGKLQFALANTSPGWAFVDTGFTPPNNQWSHVALVYDGTKAMVYVNGALFYSCAASGNIGDTLTSQNDFRIGGRQCCGSYFGGRIDEVRMYKRALSPADILSLYFKPNYVLTLADGSQQIFGQPNTINQGQERRMYLSAIKDAAGNLVQFTYESPLRLKSVVDALGQTTVLHYDSPGNSYRVTQVEDPFHRSAYFEYDEMGRLKKITDPISISSSFTYASDDPNFITQMATPYGVSSFDYKDNSPNTGDRWLTMTDPNGTTEKVFAVVDMGAKDEPFGDLGPFSAEQPVYVEGFTGGVTDQTSNFKYRNTLYFPNFPKDFAQADSQWATTATVYHFLHETLNPPTESAILESIKPPLSSRIWFYYPGQTVGFTAAPITLRKPSIVARVVEDEYGVGQTQTNLYGYNSLGAITNYIDPKGRRRALDYYSNDRDLWRVRQTTGANNEILAQFGPYNSQHRPSSFTDAALQTYQLSWNSYGLLSQVVNPKTEVIRFNYNGGYLQNVQRDWERGTKTTTLAYDSFGRVQSVTSSDNYALGYSYDVLDRLTKVTYPDQTSEQYGYDRLDLVRTVDRTGKVTQMTYDGVGHLLTITNRLGLGTLFSWCGCGGLTSMTDPLGHRTEWGRDAQGRVMTKTYSDGKFYSFAYEPYSGRLKTVSDAKMTPQVKTYKYFLDDSLAGVSYSDGQTPGVSFTYDANYRRLYQMLDGRASPTTFGYYDVGVLGAGKLKTENGPLTGSPDPDTVTYAYDPLGRLASRTISGGGTTESVLYDKLGRVSSHVTALGTFTPGYAGDTARLTSLTYPGGQSVTLTYLDTLGDLRLSEILNTKSGGATISKFDYTYDALRRIKTWTMQADNGTPQVLSPEYDNEDELIGATLSQNSVTKAYGYAYDNAGNRTGEQIETLTPTRSLSVTPSSYDTVNQLQSRSGTGPVPVHFRGTINEPGKVTVNGQSAKMTQDPTSPSNGKIFDTTLNLDPGTREISIVATDLSTKPGGPNVTTPPKRYSVSVAGGGAKTFSYDANGNCIAEGTTTYGWDAENRLKTVINGAKRSDFSYDGFGRRISIVDNDNGIVTTKKFVWSGTELVQELDGNNTVTRQFYAEGERIGGVNYYYTRDHLGSVRELVEVVNGSAVIRARYDYDPFGRRGPNQITSGAVEADFGFTGHYYHAASTLHLALFRAYDADTGRWLNRDPIGEYGGINLYRYVGNNTVKQIDPLGLVDYGFGELTEDLGMNYDAEAANARFAEAAQPVVQQIAQAIDNASMLFPAGGPEIKTAELAVAAIRPAARAVGSYIIKCKNELYYVGKGPFSRMSRSIRRLFRRGEKPVEAVFESAQPATDSRALMDEAQKIRDLGGVNGGKLLNVINSPGEKMLPAP